MSARVFLLLCPLLALGGFGSGYLLGARRQVPSQPGPMVDPAAEAAFQTALASGDLPALGSLAERERGTSLGARAQLALVRSSGPDQRPAARLLFLSRYPHSWLRGVWAPAAPPQAGR